MKSNDALYAPYILLTYLQPNEETSTILPWELGYFWGGFDLSLSGKSSIKLSINKLFSLVNNFVTQLWFDTDYREIMWDCLSCWVNIFNILTVILMNKTFFSLNYFHYLRFK